MDAGVSVKHFCLRIKVTKSVMCYDGLQSTRTEVNSYQVNSYSRSTRTIVKLVLTVNSYPSQLVLTVNSYSRSTRTQVISYLRSTRTQGQLVPSQLVPKLSRTHGLPKLSRTHGQLVPKSAHTHGQVVPKLSRTQGQLVPKSTRTQVISYSRSTRTQVSSYPRSSRAAGGVSRPACWAPASLIRPTPKKTPVA